MDDINVLVADLSQLSRLGLIGILHQMRFRMNIREIATPDKLYNAAPKELNGLFIVSRSFLNACPAARFQSIRHQFRSAVIILIRDTDPNENRMNGFADEIEISDTEKIIFRKLEKQLSALSRQKNQGMPPEEISQREKDVLRLVALGLTNKEIGEKLYISSHTVITHRKNITSKLGIKTIAGLTVYALLNRLIAAEELK